jgi:hypothetical protein
MSLWCTLPFKACHRTAEAINSPLSLSFANAQLHLDIFKRPSLLSAESLAVDLSIFHPVGPLHVHALHTLPPSKRVQRIVHFNHGFGASSFSFTPVLHRLARSLEAATIAHDCPGRHHITTINTILWRIR